MAAFSPRAHVGVQPLRVGLRLNRRSQTGQERTYNNDVAFSELPIGRNGLREQAAEQSPMDEWTREILGPYYGLALCSGGLFAWWLRNSLRRKHLLIFVGIGALAGACFCFLALLFVVGANKVTHPALALVGFCASAAIGTAAAGATLMTMLLLPRNIR